MKDARGHGSNPRGGAAAHQQGVSAVGAPRMSVSDRVIDVIRNNPNGFSVRPSGEQPSAGHQVAIPNREEQYSARELSGPNAKQIIEDFVNKHADVFANPAVHIGGWLNEKEGKVSLEPSENIRGRGAAVAAGRARNQIAIWDVKHGKTVDTGGSGKY